MHINNSVCTKKLPRCFKLVLSKKGNMVPCNLEDKPDLNLLTDFHPRFYPSHETFQFGERSCQHEQISSWKQSATWYCKWLMHSKGYEYRA